MVEEAVVCRRKHYQRNFYTAAKDALGTELSIYVAQYPQLYTGMSKRGNPLFFSKPGVLNVSGLECITTIEGILRYHWHEMINSFGGQLQKNTKQYNLKRFECICVIDLSNLSSSQVTKRALNIVKIQSEIDSLCFPETLSRLIVVNAPGFFSLTWKMIRNWVDARTANKVEIYSSKLKSDQRLRELVDINQLPSDYGGTAISTRTLLETEVLQNENKHMKKLISKVLPLRGHSSLAIEVPENQLLRLSAFTRCRQGATLAVTCQSRPLLTGVTLKHNGVGIDEEEPTRIDIVENDFMGPYTYKIKLQSNGGATISARNFLIIGQLYSTDILSNGNAISEDTKSVPTTLIKESSYHSYKESQNQKSKTKNASPEQERLETTVSTSLSTINISDIGDQVLSPMTMGSHNNVRNSFSHDGALPSENDTAKISDPESILLADDSKDNIKKSVMVDEDYSYQPSLFGCGWSSCW